MNNFICEVSWVISNHIIEKIDYISTYIKNKSKYQSIKKIDNIIWVKHIENI